MPLPTLSDAATAELRAALPSFGTPHNPLDITGGAVLQPDLFEQGLRILGRQPEFSALACLFDVPVAEEHATEFVLAALRHIAAGLRAADVPALMISHTVKPVTEISTRIIEEIGLPYVSAGLHHGMNALGRAFWWSEQYRRLAPAHRRRSRRLPTRPNGRDPSARRWISWRAAMCRWCRRRWPRRGSGGGGGTRDRRARGAEDRFGRHRAQERHWRRRAEPAKAMRRSATRSRRIMAAAPDGRAGRWRAGGADAHRAGWSCLLAARAIAQWGPVIAVGLGGVWVEVLQDVALRPLPIDAAEVKRMLGELRGAKLLHGVRGMPAADLDAVGRVIARIGDAAVALGGTWRRWR